MLVDTATEADGAAVLALIHRMGSHDAVVEKDFTAAYRACLADPGYRALVARDGRRVIGYAELQLTPYPARASGCTTVELCRVADGAPLAGST